MSIERTREGQLAEALKHAGHSIAVAITEARESCLDCEHFIEASETCRLAQARPPARVIAFGCESFSMDIPF